MRFNLRDAFCDSCTVLPDYIACHLRQTRIDYINADLSIFPAKIIGIKISELTQNLNQLAIILLGFASALLFYFSAIFATACAPLERVADTM